MSRIICLAFLAMVVPVTGNTADLSAAEILARMRMQAGAKQIVEGTRQGVTALGPAMAGENMATAAPDRRSGPTPGPGAKGQDHEPPQRLGEASRIELQILFEFDSATLAPKARSQLGELCTAFRQSLDINRPFTLIGHTDAVGDEAYNLRLSRSRAGEVRRYLVEECGIDPQRVRAEGRGEGQLRPGLNPRDPMQRRVEVQITG